MDQLELAEELGRRAGVALHNAAVHAERAVTAATLESALLPPPLPVIPGLELAARFRAARPEARVGGDFYEVFEVDGGWMAIFGDVTGKGPGAAAVTALARHTMRTAAKYEPSPAGVLEHLNEVLATEAFESLPCTAVCIRFESVPGGRARAVVAAAGHPLPLLVRAGGNVQQAGAGGTILGVLPAGEWSDVLVDLEAGDLLVLYTDGVPDTRGPGERFGSARLEALVAEGAGTSADAMAGRIDGALRDFEVGEQADDIALLVVGGTTP
jgi:serine phosphatase RsbU (regulator of sigma subunit)